MSSSLSSDTTDNKVILRHKDANQFDEFPPYCRESFMHLDNPRNRIVVGNLGLIGAPSQIGPGRETKTKSVNNMPCGISLQYLKSHISTLISQQTY